MLPAVLPICVFFTLYACAGLGQVLSGLVERDTRSYTWQSWASTCLVAALWPVFVVFLVVVFVISRERR